MRKLVNAVTATRYIISKTLNPRRVSSQSLPDWHPAYDDTDVECLLMEYGMFGAEGSAVIIDYVSFIKVVFPNITVVLDIGIVDFMTLVDSTGELQRRWYAE